MGKIIQSTTHRAHAGKGWAATKRYGFLAIFGILALALFFGCGGSSTGNGKEPSANLTRIVVEIHDSDGNPLEGFAIYTAPATSAATTDSAGKATIDNIVEGGYLVTIQKYGYTSFSRVYTVAAGYPLTIALTYIPRVSITVQDEKGRPASGATLSTLPTLPEKILDQEGKAEYINIPAVNYSFFVKREKFPDSSFHGMTLKNDMVLVLESIPPQMTILSPQENAKIASTRNIHLLGKGGDVEDGELPDSSLVWYSSRNGELGRGRELLVDMLPTGNHTITLAGTDSDGKQGETSIGIQIYDFYLNSYFPIPIGDTWDYRVQVPEFYVTDARGTAEFWSIKQLTVKMIAGPIREITMEYDVARGIDVFHCVYTLTDHLQIDANSISIAFTEESYTESVTSVPLLRMYISTSYLPHYLLLKNFIDMSGEKTWTIKSDINVVWNYVYYGQSSRTFTEWELLSATCSLGGEQSVQTDKGAFPAVELTIQEKGITRKWMLAKGLGIIRIEDSSFDPLMTMILHDSSLFKYAVKAFGSGIAPAISGEAPPRYDLRIDRTDARDVRKLLKLLSTMCVR